MANRKKVELKAICEICQKTVKLKTDVLGTIIVSRGNIRIIKGEKVPKELCRCKDTRGKRIEGVEYKLAE